MKDNPILEKSFAFALRLVKLYKYLCEEKAEYVLSKAVLTSGTNVGKHVKEALSGETRQVFVGEMAVALKKASETEYWLELLRAADYLDEKAFASINGDCQELMRLLTSIVKTSKSHTE
ncbi:MAG TPA: four helix bundle protein [Pyrinomonadaceae bacterium]|jgi:four helix bundle protein